MVFLVHSIWNLMEPIMDIAIIGKQVRYVTPFSGGCAFAVKAQWFFSEELNAGQNYCF